MLTIPLPTCQYCHVMMTFKEYLEKNDLSDVVAGEQLGCSNTMINRYRNGKRSPGKTMMWRIFNWSAGRVDSSSFGLPVRGLHEPENLRTEP